MKSLLEKLNKAKLEIKETKIEKAGWNDYSQYAYFTPEQIEFLVAQACRNNGLLTTFDLVRNELGIYGLLTIYEIETGGSLQLQMATEIPQIKATNTAQQLGGCMTYTERYLKTSAFGITDNRLDFDTTENTKKNANKPEAKKQKMSWGQTLNALDNGFDEMGAKELFTQTIESAGYDLEGAYALSDKDLQKELYLKLNNQLKTFRNEK